MEITFGLTPDDHPECLSVRFLASPENLREASGQMVLQLMGKDVGASIAPGFLPDGMAENQKTVREGPYTFRYFEQYSEDGKVMGQLDTMHHPRITEALSL